jgi:hypothetical protein
MGWRRGKDLVPSADWRLPSLGGGLDPASSKQYDKQEAHQLRLERLRKNVQNARAAYLGEVGQTAKRVSMAAIWQTDYFARSFPEERGALDVIDQAIILGVANIVQEMAS